MGQAGTMPAPASARRRAGRDFFDLDGSRAVFRVAAAVGVLMLALTLWQVLKPRPYYTGSAAVGNHGIAVTIPAHRTMCSSGMHIPSGTGIVRMLAYLSRAPTRVRVTVGRPALGRAVTGVQSVNGPGGVPIPLEQSLGPHPETGAATICVSALSAPVSLAG